MFRDPIEQSLTVGCTEAWMIAPGDLRAESQSAHLAQSNLYLIVRRPRLRITDCHHRDGRAFLVLQAPSGSTLTTSFTISDPTLIEIEDGGYYLKITTGGETVFDAKPSRLLHMSPFASFDDEKERLEMHKELLDLEVLYVGKSDDVEGALNKRLAVHGTLQRILADHSDHAPDYELWVVLLEFAHLTTMTAILPSGSMSEEMLSKKSDAISPQVGEKAKTALAEAAMIRYFVPSYNTHYAKNFPSRDHKSYAEVIGFDFNSIGFVLDVGAALGIRLKSDSVAPAARHEKSFPVDTLASRSPLTPEAIAATFSRGRTGYSFDNFEA